MGVSSMDWISVGKSPLFIFKGDPLRKLRTFCNATQVYVCLLSLMYAYFIQCWPLPSTRDQVVPQTLESK